MSKTVILGGWVSIVPTKMYDKWVEKEYIEPGKNIFSRISDKDYEIVKKEINDWYDKVFKYVEKWLKAKKFIQLKQGSFMGGFCAEGNPDSECVKGWGAPLEKPGNKVGQIKEKFGFITVYFHSLTEKDEKQIEAFAKQVEKKFDCETHFN